MLLNKLVLLFYQIMRRLHIWHHPNYPDNYAANEIALGYHTQKIEQNDGFIEDQSAYTDMRYGNQKVSFCGCEVIATYNALKVLETCDCHRFVELLSMYEKDGIVCGGFFGTAPQAISDYFAGIGYELRVVERESEYDQCGNTCDVFILTMYNNRRKISDMIHTVCITKDTKGYFTMHNAGMEQQHFSGIMSLLAAYNKGRAGGIQLIGIKRPKV